MMNVKRIKGEVKQMIESPPPGLSIRSSENDLCYVDCTMQAPGPGSPYQGGRFELIYRWTHHRGHHYPFSPPEVRFRTKIYHPNIDSHGNISLSFLTYSWSVVYTIYTTLLSIQSILDDPLLDTPLVPEIARIYRTDRAQYNKNAKAWTMRYATGVSLSASLSLPVEQTGFQSISYVRDIHPWLCSLEAVDLRLAVQREGLLTLDQVHRLEDVRSTHSKERHNRDVLCIVEPQGIDGFIKLYNGLSREFASIGEGLQMMKAVIPVDQHARLES
eukprot:scpid89187/ scgid19967/ Ubiquitin-conjugating enzyme E2 2; Lethal protein 70; Ubiquitin carrier protein 2; Ubiquitin-protein ligase 2